MTASREKNSFRLPPELVRQLGDTAIARRVSRTAIVEAALASYLSPDGADRLEAAVSRRLDRITRQLDRLAWHVELSNETLALFIRFWLTTTPALPEPAAKAARAQAGSRYDNFVAALGRRLSQGPKLRQEIPDDVREDPTRSTDTD